MNNKQWVEKRKKRHGVIRGKVKSLLDLLSHEVRKILQAHVLSVSTNGVYDCIFQQIELFQVFVKIKWAQLRLYVINIQK